MSSRSLRILALVAGLSAVVLALSGSCRRALSRHPQVIVIGFDGMDPRLCERLMDEGSLPNLCRLRDAGGYRRLGTTIPPQSPVAWASFITGANPGVHGVFDFIHRDPKKQCAPYYSAAETVQGEDAWEVGKHRLPLTFWPFNHPPTQTLLRRDGIPFWDYLDAAGIPTRIYDIPANYPPSPSNHGHMCCLSGMGVPDLRGGYGTYQVFSERVILPMEEGGGMRFPLTFQNHRAKASLLGPINTTLADAGATTGPAGVEIPFTIFRHPTEDWVRLELPENTVVLKEGEWSDWQRLDFTLEMPSFLPNAHVSGICRFFVQAVHPETTLYVTPLNIDPSDPGEQRISEPPSFVTAISDELGLFYTAGFQEDHKALSNRVFTDADYKRQADYVLGERLTLLNHAKKHYRDGLLFFYFSSTDQQAHMLWWDSQEKHPTRSAEDAAAYHRSIIELYRRADEIVGGILAQYGSAATVLVMSDHGFCNFRRQFDLNTWLRENGYLQPATAQSILDGSTDWTKTRAYGLGLNGLYVNLKGRERDGIVETGDRDRLMAELEEKLLAVRDPVNGAPVVKFVYRADRVYSGTHVANAPDLIVGYHRDYRVSWATTLGDVAGKILTDNDSAWSADHCIAADEVPGVLFANRPVVVADPDLTDLAPTILRLFGVAPGPAMSGRNLFAAAASTDAAPDRVSPRAPNEGHNGVRDSTVGSAAAAPAGGTGSAGLTRNSSSRGAPVAGDIHGQTEDR